MKVIGNFLGLISLLTFYSCGQTSKVVNRNQDDVRKGELLSIPLSISSGSNSSLNLKQADGFKIQVDGCQSGYTATVNEVDPTIRVYKNDRNCLAKLESLVLDGFLYEPKPGSGFQTWLPGDLAFFQKAGSNDTSLRVLVKSQLSSPVLTEDSVSYEFSEVKRKDPKTIPGPEVSEAHKVGVEGELAPPFHVFASSFQGINAKGAGLFEFILECDLLQTGSDASSSCGGSLNSDIDYKLVEDTFSGKLTYLNAVKIFSSPGTQVLGVDNHASGTQSKNGGFKTTGPLFGPDQMHLRPKMILVLRRAGISFTYFNISVSTLFK